MGQAYQARYQLKKNTYNEPSGLLDSLFNMFNSDKAVEITKTSHLPIFLLHKKFVLPEGH